jgi:hypothetical protein
MRRFLTIGLPAVALAAGFLAGLAGCQRSARPEDFEWTTIDESYTPKNYVEQFIKSDAEQKGIFPVYIRNYGKDPAILKRFRGTNFARPAVAALNLAYRGLDDWLLLEIKYRNEKQQEVLRAVLYVEIGGNWKVGDSGALLK